MAKEVIINPNIVYRPEDSGATFGIKSVNDVIGALIYYMRSSAEGNNGIFKEILDALGGGGPAPATEATLQLVLDKLEDVWPTDQVFSESLGNNGTANNSMQGLTSGIIHVTDVVSGEVFFKGHSGVISKNVPIIAQDLSTGAMVTSATASGMYLVDNLPPFLYLTASPIANISLIITAKTK